jgi:menaquinone-9 beta-reductase
MIDADVAIVGAGPAGAWAASTLARRGARVVLLDASHPREKPCGGGVSGRALALVHEAVAAARISRCTIARARFLQASGGQSATIDLVGRDPAGAADLIVASRRTFDAALVSAAHRHGATLVEARVLDVVADPARLRLETTAGPVHARFLIGADGVNSLMRRRLARPFRRDEISVATGFFAHGVTSAEIVIELIDEPPGYLWSFPRPDHLAIGICAQADAGVTSTALRRRVAEWICETGIGRGAVLQPYAWPIPSLTSASLRGLTVAGQGWCLTGDAAGLVDPITREGIYFALLSAEWAADAADGGDAHQYDARLRAEVIPELARAAELKEMFFRLASGGLLLRVLDRSPALRRVMADLIAGRQGYAGLRRRLLEACDWRLAASVAREIAGV